VWLAVADDADLRRRGLMNVTTLEPLDGMMFVFEDDTTAGFWMKDTLIALDIAFFDAEGLLVAVRSMVPCEADSCPTYSAGAPYRFAVEVAGGGFADLPSDARLEL